MSQLDSLVATACTYDQDKFDQHHLAQSLVYNNHGELVLPGDGLFTTEVVNGDGECVGNRGSCIIGRGDRHRGNTIFRKTQSQQASGDQCRHRIA